MMPAFRGYPLRPEHIAMPGKNAGLPGICRAPFHRLYDLRSTYATRLSAGGVADEWVTQLLRQSDAKVFKKYSQMKLQMKREALTRLNRQAGESGPANSFDTEAKK